MVINASKQQNLSRLSQLNPHANTVCRRLCELKWRREVRRLSLGRQLTGLNGIEHRRTDSAGRVFTVITLGDLTAQGILADDLPTTYQFSTVNTSPLNPIVDGGPADVGNAPRQMRRQEPRLFLTFLTLEAGTE